MLAGAVNAAVAQLQLLPALQPQCVFAGEARKINMVWRNAGEQPVTAKIRARIFQASSATAVLWREMGWKQLPVLPGQTVLESAAVDFPAVPAETTFLVQWLTGSNEVSGVTTVQVYPTNLLSELKTLTMNQAVGVYDPENELKPLLRDSGIMFDDLEISGLENFSGRLAIIGIFSNKVPLPENFAKQVKILTQKNVAVVWIQPPSMSAEKPVPSFYIVPQGTNAVVVVAPDLVSGLAENPPAQQNLIYFCKLALWPKPPELPLLARRE